MIDLEKLPIIAKVCVKMLEANYNKFVLEQDMIKFIYNYSGNVDPDSMEFFEKVVYHHFVGKNKTLEEIEKL